MADPQWRLLEKLARSIEHAIAPGAIVKSPDRLLDHDTGEMREVDVSIRYHVGSVQILIIVECRKHKSTQDVRWIEQIATKKAAVGAHAAIAVSTSGFSQPAQEKAAKRGVELRQVKRIEDAHVEEWFRGINVTLHYLTYQALTVGIIWPDSKRPFTEELKEIQAPDAWHSPIFQEGPDRKPTTLTDLIQGNWQILEGEKLPLGGKETKRIYIRPDAGTLLYFPYRAQSHPVGAVELTIEVEHCCQTVKLETLNQYAGKDSILAYSGHGKVTAGLDNPIEIVMLRHSGGLTLSFSQERPKQTRRKSRKK